MFYRYNIMKIAMKDNGMFKFVLIEHKLKAGSDFCFIAKWDEDESSWELNFTINQSFYPEQLGKGEKVEATKLLLAIWKRFSKKSCWASGATESHTKTYLGLGFQDLDGVLIYNPKRS